MAQSFINAVRQAAEQRILFLPHALEEMNAPDELISTEEVRNTIFFGDIIEDYPEDVRGHSCLMLGHGNGERPVHVVCSPKREYLAVITVYIPSTTRWMSDWKTRKPRM